MLNPLWLYHTLFPFFFLLHLAGEYISPASARVLLVLITFLLSSSQGGAILSLWLLHSAVFAVAWLVSRSNFSFPYIPQFAVIDFPKRPSSIVTLPFIFYDAHMRTTSPPRWQIWQISAFTDTLNVPSYLRLGYELEIDI